MLTFLQMVILMIIVFLCSYTILDRLCKCIEICSTNRSFKKFIEKMNKECNNGTSGKPESCESGEKSQDENR